ncbi:predicted protein, partial [Nematostella vectensis]
QKKWYVFTPELSCSGCDPEADSVTTVNIAYAIMTEVAKGYSRIVRVGIDALLKYEKEHLFMTRTVREVLWGYDDPLFAEFSKLKDMFNLKFLPEISPLITMEYNETYDGISTVNTGTKNMDRTLDWIAWKGQSSMGLWNSSYANMINGSDGTQFPPGSGPGDTLYFFSTNLCRSIYLKFDSAKKMKGIPVNRYTTPASLFKNYTEVSSNRDFCLGRCYPDGILAGSQDCTPSTVTSPIVISTPHF